MSWYVSLDPSGNEVTEYRGNTRHGDMLECHYDPPTCECVEESKHA